MRVFALVVLCAALCYGDDSFEKAFGLLKDCKGDYSLCIKEKLLTLVENVRSTKSLTLANGVYLKADAEKRLARKAEPLPENPEERDAEVNSRLIDGVLGVAETHRLEVKLGDKDAGESVKRSLEEGRKKKKGGMSGLGAIAGLILLKLGLKKLLIIKLIALKALVVGKIALILAGILLAQHLFNQGHTKTTYEVVPHHHEVPVHHPHIEHSFSGHVDHGHHGAHSEPSYTSYSASSGGDWAKPAEDSHNIAYSGHQGYSK